MNYDIPIAVATYNRPDSLERLLRSIQNALYDAPVKLYLSVDGGCDNRTIEIVRNFEWSQGEKEIIFHENNIGLRNHILSLSAISEKHEGIIILEDDLYVSQVFYQYAQQCFDFYLHDQDIGGFSLFSHHYNATAQFPFYPLHDDSDVFFIQYASSWGQFFSRTQWVKFTNWYSKNRNLNLDHDTQLPPDVAAWPETSWKKYFIKFLIERNCYFVFPRQSFVTNFCDNGQHMKHSENYMQLPLQYQNKRYTYKKIDESYSVYDAFCEILPDRLNRLYPHLKNYDYETDLYGMKYLKNIQHQFILTTQYCYSSILSFGRKMKPLEANIIENIPGKEINLALVHDCKEKYFWDKLNKCHEKNELAYYYGLRHWHFNKKFKILIGLMLRLKFLFLYFFRYLSNLSKKQ